MDIPISSFKIKQKGSQALLFYLSISDLVMLQVKNILFSFFIFFVLANQICAQELEPLSRIQDMKEIHVNNGNQVALAQLLLHSVQTTQPSQVQLVSKAYLEVKSYLGGVQLELVEADFNINHGPYGPIANEFKTGRFALYPYENRYFRFEASADALLDFNLTSPNELFPYSPFNVGRKPEKHFRFWLADTLQIGENDTLLEIKFVPKKKDGPLLPEQHGSIYIPMNCAKYCCVASSVLNSRSRHYFIQIAFKI